MTVILWLLFLAALAGCFVLYKETRRQYWITKVLTVTDVVQSAYLIGMTVPDYEHFLATVLDDLARVRALVNKGELFPDVKEYTNDFIDRKVKYFKYAVNLRIKSGIDVTV